jgi:hypothetical protein
MACMIWRKTAPYMADQSFGFMRIYDFGELYKKLDLKITKMSML